ncbi:MAG TPA: hypothetical protein ENL20_06535 [Candidatus Cloacimonetes bacterium]|nr:hypothetical protein [Candidatus Cloacimonadota bacterium]
MKIISLTIIILMGISLFGNSVFSFDGMPLQNYGNDVYEIGMGGSGSSDLFRINTNYSNPSLVTTANKVIFSTAVALGYVWYADNKSSGFRDDGLNLPYFTLAVPIKNHKFAFCFNSYTSGNLNNEITGTWIDEQNTEYNYRELNRLRSNIYKTDIIYAYKNKYLNLGFSANYYLGSKVRFWQLDFDDELNDAKEETKETYKNAGFSFGGNKKIGNVSFAAAYSSEVDLKGESIYKYDHEPFEEVIESDMVQYEIPRKISGGMTWKFLEKYKTSLDINYDFWEETESSDFNTYKLACGLAYDPLSGYGKWYQRIPLRFGGYYRELPFKKNDEKIIEKAFSLGCSIPLKTPSKKLDLAVKFLLRGDLEDNGMRDKAVMFYFGITGFDIFSKRPKKIEHRDIPKADGM